MISILLPIDGTPPSQTAIAHGLGLAARYAARLLFLAVEEPTVPSLTDCLKSFDGVCQAASGEVTTEILRYAEDQSVDLIVMSAQGRDMGWPLGSVTQAVLQRAHCPVMVIPVTRGELNRGIDRVAEAQAGGWPHYSRILLPLDGSESSEKAVTTAAFLAGKDQSELVLLQVLDAPGLDGHYLRGLAERLEKQGLRVRPEEGHGDPAQTILEHAIVDLIVMSTHGRSGLERALLGSVAETVVRQSQCPVLLVRGQSLLTQSF